MNILFVCTGNTCRSPMAQGLFNALSRKKGLDAAANSAGLFASSGSPASGYAIEAMANLGIDISFHQAKQITKELIEKADVVIPLTQGHYDALKNKFPQYEKKLRLLNEPVQDPYGGSMASYEKTAAQLERLISDLL